ncbi:MAG: di-heme-cytochrome C peroxidase [Rickettsiales bacterium]
MNFINTLLYRIVLFVSKRPKAVVYSLLFLAFFLPFVGIVGAKIFQRLDRDPARGAVAVKGGEFGEDYAAPEYLNQGWKSADSLWFYNTTQGSALMPYDFLLALEQSNPKKNVECERNAKKAPWFLCDNNVDRFRYLPQKQTLFNPDALPVGFTKETYQGKDYVGLTCAACHTGQINFKGKALRIDGGPAMADMTNFLTELTRSMRQTKEKPTNGKTNPKLERFVQTVLTIDNDYKNRAEIEKDLEKWTDVRRLYNHINHSVWKDDDGKKIPVDYGYARLDAFGRIYNRVLQHTINREQLKTRLGSIRVMKNGKKQDLLTKEEIDKTLENVGDGVIFLDKDFWQALENLQSTAPGYPGLTAKELSYVSDAVFNSPNAPVSYPFLWDITHSDYVQWNALANNAELGALGRNTGEVIGVFGILDWHEDNGLWAKLGKLSLAATVSGQTKHKKYIDFQSSIDLFNLQRLERHLNGLTSPKWPFCRNKETGEYYLSERESDKPVDERPCDGDDVKIDAEKALEGKLVYERECRSCHDVIDRTAWDRLVVGKLVGIDHKQATDKAMAENSVLYSGKSGNFKDTYQATDVGTVVVREDAPVAQILTAVTKGVVATPDADKWWPRRMVEWVYALVGSLADNAIQMSVKSGQYSLDTAISPYDSLKSYRARSLNGIWATAPYLHNGSVPTLYDLLLPEKNVEGCNNQGEIRPKRFKVGSREFDPEKVGFKSEGYDGFTFNADIRGNGNMGHEYGACKMTNEERKSLVEYLKSL